MAAKSLYCIYTMHSHLFMLLSCLEHSTGEWYQQWLMLGIFHRRVISTVADAWNIPQMSGINSG